MARDVLAVPATSVSLERLFSAARDVGTHRQGHLKLTTVRKLVMLRHHNAAELTLVELENQEAESLEPDSRYSRNDNH
jgi:hypothetical protein